MLAAVLLKQAGLVRRVSIIDIDMHYGNGTEEIREILINQGMDDFISHYTFGNLPVAGDVLVQSLPEILDRYLPEETDVIFYQAGADPHVDDPYGGFMTTAELKERDRIVFTKAKERGIPLVWNLAGGYQSDFSKVLEIHNNTALMHCEIFG